MMSTSLAAPTRLGSAVCGVMTLVFCIWSTQAIAQSCPPSIGNGSICNANDFNVTSVVVAGPTECTQGETISVTVDVGLESTAKSRYDIGLFAGDDGGPVFAGPSCSFISLAPLALEPPPFNGTSGVGPYRELDGDQCGDVTQAELTVRRFQLDSVLCRDNDGDGRVDIAGLVTWSSNANADICTDPTDRTQFFPVQTSKCQLDPDLNIPIIVEPPISVVVDKVALPGNLPAPGGTVRFLVGLSNSSSITDPLTLTSLVDDIHGDLNGQGTCSVPQLLAPRGLYVCEFTADVTGSAGYSETDTVTAQFVDDDGDTVQGSDTATVTITDAPATMEVVKAALPRLVPEPGGIVTYVVAVANTSDTESISITDLTDDLYGDVFTKGTCAQPGGSFLLAPRDYLLCTFKEQVTGQPGDVITDVITANAVSVGGQSLSESDSASVFIYDVAAAIEVKKTAIPPERPEPGGTFSFELSIQNISPTDSVTLDSITDRIGLVSTDVTTIPGSTCSVPQTLVLGAFYECTFDIVFTGAPGDFQVDTVTVLATDDDGQSIGDFAFAQVVISDVPAEIEVVKTASPSEINDGDLVTFSVTISNTSVTDTVTISSLGDDLYGNITQVQGDIQSTTCTLSQVLVPGASYGCDFVVTVNAGVPLPTVVTDIVTASGTDDEVPSNAVTASDSASVLVVAGVPTPPDSLQIAKVAVPSTLPEPGGNALYLVVLYNPSASAIRVTSLLDDLYDLQGTEPGKEPVLFANNCTPPIDIVAGGFARCTFGGLVSGSAGDLVTDVVTAQACVPPACATSPLSDTDDATVSITPGPASIALNKTASPVFIGEPGGVITFTVEVQNTSLSEVVTIDSLDDDIYGDLDGQGDCAVPQILQPAGSVGDTYLCSFDGDVAGVDGDLVIDIVTAAGSGGSGDPVSAQDDATVRIFGVAPTVSITKTATPNVVQPPGGTVTFSVTVTNTSAADNLNITQLTDDIYGDLDGQGDCLLPQSIAPAGDYSCSFPGDVMGNEFALHRDTITVSATTDDDQALSDQASALVFIRTVSETLGIPIFGVWGLLATIVLLAVAGLRVLVLRPV